MAELGHRSGHGGLTDGDLDRSGWYGDGDFRIAPAWRWKQP